MTNVSSRLARGLVPLLSLVLLPTVASAQYVVGPGPGGSPTVHLIDTSGDHPIVAYDPSFLGGVSVALGDVDGDGVYDVITGAGFGGGPHVRVFSGTDFHQIASFFAYDPSFTGGISVAAGDVDGDGRADIITGAGPGGGPHVLVFSGQTLGILASFFAYDVDFTGGVHVAAGDVTGDGLADIITGAGPGGGPHVQVFRGTDLTVIASFMAYDVSLFGGVTVAAADFNGDGHTDIVTGAGAGGGPHVKVFNSQNGDLLASFFAYDATFAGGVFVATGDLNGDGQADIITGPGFGGGPHVKVFSGTDLSVLASLLLGDGSGATVGSIGDGASLRFTSAASTTFTVGTPGTFLITTAGNPTTIIETGPLPSGVTVTDNGDGTATLSGTPGGGTAGTYPLTFTATRGSTTTTQSFTLTVRQAPAITSASAVTFNVGAPGTFMVTTTGSPTPAITAAGALPSGVTFLDNGNGTATLAGTPAAGTGGSYVLTIAATNGIGAPATQTFSLTVSAGPAFTSASSTTFTVGSPGTFTVTTVGTPTPALTVTGALADGGHLHGQRQRDRHAERAARRGHRRQLSPDDHRVERRAAQWHAGLHVERQSGASDHQRERNDVHRRDGRVVHGHDVWFPGAGDRDWRHGVAGRRDVCGQR